jgi:hypothetical protein
MNKKQINIYVSIHKGIRNLVGRFSMRAGATDWNDSEAVSKLHEEWTKTMLLLDSHQQHEDKFIHPLLNKISLGSHRGYEADHQLQLKALKNLDFHFKRLMNGNGSAGKKNEIGLEFYRELNLFYSDFLRHLHREETEAERILNTLCLPEELTAMLEKLIGSIPQDEMLLYIDCMFPAMNLPECVDLLKNIKKEAPVVLFQGLLDRIRKIRGELDWEIIKNSMDLLRK